MNKSFDIFLSHNSKDKPAVRQLAEALRGRGLNVWLDEWELVPGRPWQETLEEIIATTRSSAVLVGKDGLGPWQDAEMRGCLAEFVSRKLPVIPVLLPGAPEKPTLPIFLKGFTWVDLRGGLTAEGIDQLQWGVSGRRPDLANPIAKPGANLDACVGQAFTEPLTGIRFLWIPGGRFQMGGYAHANERPLHWVRLSPFWLGETQVTNRQYAMFIEKTRVKEPEYWRDRQISLPDHPVGVSWEEADAFCQWLAEETGWRIMLPSEAQWEFAARGTDGREYPWGNESPDETRACYGRDTIKNFLFNFNRGKKLEPVGSFPAGRGPFGTLDQAGNFWDWCQDTWDEEAYIKRKGGEPLDPVVGGERVREEVKRVLRGGNWGSPAGYLRAAYRFAYYSRVSGPGSGFRVAATT